MSHVRQQIRDYAKAALIAAPTAAGSNVECSRVYPYSTANLPALNVYTPNEEVDEDFDTTGGVLRRYCNLTVDARIALAKGAFPENALDDLAAEVETVFGLDPTFGGLIGWVRLASTETGLDGEGEKVVGLATLAFRAQYESLASDPTTAIG